MKNRAELITARINRNIEDAQEVLAKFAADLQKDAVYALAWGDKAFQAAAVIKVCQFTLATATRVIEEDGCDLEGAYAKCSELLINQIMRNAAFVSASSSHCTNLIDQHTLAAKVAVVELLDC